jgi:hypothetical protein
MALDSSLSCTAVDNTFGPWARECRGGFDFTLLFEDAILSITPLALLLAIAPFRIFFLWRKKTKVSRSVLLPVKLVGFSLYPQPLSTIFMKLTFDFS